MTESKLTDRDVAAVPGLEGVYVRTISGKEYKQFQAGCRDLAELPEEERNVRAVYLLVNLTACSADGRRLFEDAAMTATEETPITKARAVYEAAVQLNRLSEKKAES